MLKEVKKFIKKCIALCAIFSILSIYFPVFSHISIATDDNLILSTPENIELNEDYIGSWSKVDNVHYYRIDYKIITSSGIEKIGYADEVHLYDLTEKDGIVSANLTEALNYAYDDALCNSPEEVQISFRVCAKASYQTEYLDSEFSEYSNSILYPKRTQLTTPTEVTLGEDLYGTWTAENFTFADQIGKFELDYKIIYENSEKTGYINYVSRYSCSYPEENTVRVYLKDALNQAYTQAGFTREKVQISFRVRAISNTQDMYKDSEYSEYSNFILFAYDGKNPLNTPTNVTLSEDFYGSWNKVDNADYYSIEYKITYNNLEKIIIADSIEDYNIAENNGIITTNLQKSLEKAYSDAGYLGEKVLISYRIAASVRYYDYTLKYTDSLFSEYSNEIYYQPNTNIPTFDISGTITSYNSDTDNILLQLYKEGASEAFVEINVKGNDVNYSIIDVLSGNYIIKIIKNNHLTREYSIFIDSSDIIQDIQIYLIGDINEDGKVNIKDWNRLYNHINETDKLTDYQLLCADVNGDEKVNIKDWNRIYDHIREVNPLW